MQVNRDVVAFPDVTTLVSISTGTAEGDKAAKHCCLRSPSTSTQTPKRLYSSHLEQNVSLKSKLHYRSNHTIEIPAPDHRLDQEPPNSASTIYTKKPP
jgi:hypothetical protein